MEKENKQEQDMENAEFQQNAADNDSIKDEVESGKSVDAEQADGNEEEIVDEEGNEIKELQTKLAALNDSHLRLMADFDNYKKKTLKERSDLIKYGGENMIKNLLPVIDDFERALAAMPEGEAEAVKEGVVLIYGKFMKFLQQSGVKEISTAGEVFNTDFHEAVTIMPSQDENQKGKIVDCVQKGYTFHDKVIRYAKVVVAQ